MLITLTIFNIFYSYYMKNYSYIYTIIKNNKTYGILHNSNTKGNCW